MGVLQHIRRTAPPLNLPASKYGRLCQLAADWSGASSESVTGIVKSLLADPKSPSDFTRRSALNADGSPLQLALSVGDSGCRVRLIGDPALSAASPWRRIQLSKQAAWQLLVDQGCDALRPVAADLFDTMLPNRREMGNEGFQFGAIWLACPVTETGVALYTNALWGSPSARWDRIRCWLVRVLPSSRDAENMLSAIETFSTPASLAIEGREPHDTRVKVYFRLNTIVRLADFGVPLFSNSVLTDFLVQSFRQRTARTTGVVFCAGFALGSGELVDVKIDLCACPKCLMRAPAEWDHILAVILGNAGRTMPSLARSLPKTDTDVALVGMAVNREGRSRVNVYVKEKT